MNSSIQLDSLTVPLTGINLVEAAAGTGKTHIAIKKANRDYLLGGKVLFTCCSEHVADFARGILPSQVDCLSYEQLVKIIAGDKYDTLPKNENGYSNCFDLIDSSNTVPKYDTIVVDEAQDFDLSMGMTIRCLMKSETESSLYVFYDKNQNLCLFFLCLLKKFNLCGIILLKAREDQYGYRANKKRIKM